MGSLSVNANIFWRHCFYDGYFNVEMGIALDSGLWFKGITMKFKFVVWLGS